MRGNGFDAITMSFRQIVATECRGPLAYIRRKVYFIVYIILLLLYAHRSVNL